MPFKYLFLLRSIINFEHKTKLLRFAFLIPLAFSLLISLLTHRVPALTSDGQVYLQIARNIHFGIGLGWEALWVPPLHSILIALVAWLPGLGDLQTAASIVAGGMSALLAVSVYFLGSGLFSRSVGIIAAIITTTFPHIVNMAFIPEAEISYTALMIAALAFLLITVKRQSYLLAAVTGIMFSGAYLARSEGFLVMVFTLACLSFVVGIRFYRSIQARLALMIILFFLIASSPYLLFLEKHYGAFVISPKATYVLIWMKSRIYKDNDLGETQNPELWGLTSKGKIKWQEPTGIRDLAAYLLSHPQKSLQIYLHNLSMHIPGRIPNAGDITRYPQALPVYLALLAIVMAYTRWGEYSHMKKAILYGPFLIMLVLPIFTEGWCKYLSPYSPLLIIPATAAMFLIVDFLKTRYTISTRFVSVLPFLIAAVLSAWHLSLNIKMVQNTKPRSDRDIARGIYSEEALNAGRWGRQQFGPGKNYMISWSKSIYHLEGLWTALPAGASYSELIKFARNSKVNYIVMEIDKALSGQELSVTPPEIRFAGAYRSNRVDYALAFYELIN